jgi:class 3 adenylate cyclase
VNSTVLFLTANRQRALSLAIHLLVILSVAHLYMINVWDDVLSTVVVFQGFLGTTMVAVILAISRPRVGEYSSLYARLLWGLAIAHLFVALICIGAVVLTGDPSLIGPIIAYGVCGYVFALIIWIMAFNGEAVTSVENRVAQSTSANALLASFGPLLHYPIYYLTITAVFSQSLDSWADSLKNYEISFEVFTENIVYSAGMLLIILVTSFVLSPHKKLRIHKDQLLLNFLLMYCLFTMLSFIGMLSADADAQNLPQTTASILFPFGVVYLFTLGFSAFKNFKIEWKQNVIRDVALVAVCVVVTYFSFFPLAPTGALVFAGIAGVILGGLLAYLSNLEAKINERTAELALEKRKSDALLENILPAYVINDLKERGASEPRYFEDLSIMFTDFVGFTQMSERLSAPELISQLNVIFTRFDAIVDKHSSERIKTIGDAYMCVSGLTHSETNSANNLVDIAFEMLDYLAEHNEKFSTAWEMRIGIATGDCVGGVVGEKKYLFDLFGDTVNMASRMESHSEPGCINVDQATSVALEAIDSIVFEKRPRTQVKGKGEVTMSFVGRS